jgi:iron only hydrogenase large subunit-like protein
MNCRINEQLVYTKQDLCKVCYTCVRECPAKAIRIANGQADVMIERCIGCGNCVKVCSQGAKAYFDSREEVKALLASDNKVAAIVAPSFAAEFDDIDDLNKVVGMIRDLGFDLVNEVAFGADMVAVEYGKLMNENGEAPHISSDCPAITYYIKQYHPKLVPFLAPVASPMIAMTRALRELHQEDLKVVFVGPCIAKKAESDEIDAALTFIELRELLDEFNITDGKPEAFDPPHAGKGAIFPVSRGLLQTMNKTEDIAEGNIVVAEGRVNFKDALKEFENGLLNSHHLELLCCEGCIMGPGMSKGGKRYTRRTQISKYVKNKLNNIDEKQWKEQLKELEHVDLSQSFKPSDRRLPMPDEKEIDKALIKMGKVSAKDHLNCGACGYETCMDHAIAIAEGLAEEEMCLPFTIDKLHESINELNESNEMLANTQQALKQSEKLASMGQLSAGIAHELNNPLGVITMYSNILKDEVPEDSQMRDDLDLIVEQADRCKSIVGGLLNFARKNQVTLEETNIEDFVKRSLQSVIKPDNVNIQFISELTDPLVSIDRDQFMQVLTNLEKNAVEAMTHGGELKLSLAGDVSSVQILVSDTGVGIAQENMDKLFTPFFTTKKMGKGTGLGLPLIYGIVKMHKGQIQVKSNANPEQGETGTTFTLTIPRNKGI